LGAKLVKLFEFAKANGGLVVQMRVAMKTGITSANAAAEADSPANIDKVRAAIKEVAGVDAPAV